MYYCMLPAIPWLVTLQWSRMWWHAALPPAPAPAPFHSATILPFAPRDKRRVSG